MKKPNNDTHNFIGQLIKPFKNAILWEFDTNKMEMSQCEYNKNSLVKKDNHLYVWAVNRKNAIRKVSKALSLDLI